MDSKHNSPECPREGPYMICIWYSFRWQNKRGKIKARMEERHFKIYLLWFSRGKDRYFLCTSAKLEVGMTTKENSMGKSRVYRPRGSSALNFWKLLLQLQFARYLSTWCFLFRICAPNCLNLSFLSFQQTSFSLPFRVYFAIMFNIRVTFHIDYLQIQSFIPLRLKSEEILCRDILKLWALPPYNW